jgi:hypothetical protein
MGEYMCICHCINKTEEYRVSLFVDRDSPSLYRGISESHIVKYQQGGEKTKARYDACGTKTATYSRIGSSKALSNQTTILSKRFSD